MNSLDNITVIMLLKAVELLQFSTHVNFEININDYSNKNGFVYQLWFD